MWESGQAIPRKARTPSRKLLEIRRAQEEIKKTYQQRQVSFRGQIQGKVKTVNSQTELQFGRDVEINRLNM